MAKPETIKLDQGLIDSVVAQIRSGRPVRQVLPADGLISIDRQLPFLLVHRATAAETGTPFPRILTGSASYLLAPATGRSKGWTTRLVGEIANVLSETFGAVLIIELWPGQPPETNDGPSAAGKPGFRIHVGRDEQASSTVNRLVASLDRMTIMKQGADVERVVGPNVARPGMPRLLPAARPGSVAATVIGVEVAPIYLDVDSGEELPILGRTLARLTGRALQRTAFEFARAETSDRSMHFHALGRRTFVAAAKRVDTQLTEVAESFDLLLAVTPVNSERAFRFFQRSKFERAPRFHYRPMAVDPDLLKRRLWNIKIERVEDPVLDQLFREKRRELDLKLTLLAERERSRFRPTSMALYGPIDDALRESALTVMSTVDSDNGGRRARKVSAADLISRAEEEMERLRSGPGVMEGRIVVQDDMSSLMVSSGNLYVGSDMSFPANRVEPLIQHEVGTHVLTYWNGRAQPLKLLATGLAGHDELQEGLAVFVEYLVGGLTGTRLRTLAARVLAVGALIDGAGFVETFRLLTDDFGLSKRLAFLVTMRVFRGGGLTKDAVYLRGLESVIDYLARGGRLDTLFIGKIATEHAPVIEELQRRQVLVPPPFRPSYLDQPDAHYRIEQIRDKPTPADLVTR